MTNLKFAPAQNYARNEMALRLIVIALMEERDEGAFHVAYKDLDAMQDNYELTLASFSSHFDVSIERIPKKVRCTACEGRGEVDAP